MPTWDHDPTESILNKGHFQITDPAHCMLLYKHFRFAETIGLNLCWKRERAATLRLLPPNFRPEQFVSRWSE